MKTTQKGSLTIEAILVISIFMILSMTLFGMILSVYLEEKIQWNALQTIDEVSVYAMPFTGHERLIQTEVNLLTLSTIANSVIKTHTQKELKSLVEILPSTHVEFTDYRTMEFVISYEYQLLSLHPKNELILPMNAAAMSDGIDFKEETVFVTKVGKKYHLEGCIHLRKSKFGISLEEAIEKGYTPCKNCHGPSSFNGTQDQ